MHSRVAVLVTAALLAVALPATAAPSPQPTQGINVVPTPDSPHRSASGSFVELGTVTLGQPIKDAVLVTNGAAVQQQVLLYAADAIPSRGGGFAFKARTERNTQVGAWLHPAAAKVTLPPNGSLRVAYTVTVPTGTGGGEYVGGLIAEPVTATPSGGITTLTRFAMAVYLRVPGGDPGSTPGRGKPGGKLVVTKLKPRYDGSRVCPVVSYRNDSQDVLDPVVRVTVTGPFGSSSYERRRAGAVLPGTSADVRLACLKRPLGPSTLRLRLTTPDGEVFTAAHAVWLPLPLLFSLLLLLLLIGALITTFTRGMLERRRARAERSTE